MLAAKPQGAVTASASWLHTGSPALAALPKI